jgi:hypothetical protein
MSTPESKHPSLKEDNSHPEVLGESFPAFSDDKIDAKTVKSEGGYRTGFTKKAYVTPCGRGNFGPGLAG